MVLFYIKLSTAHLCILAVCQIITKVLNFAKKQVL